jgi:hypothetical protein
MHGGFTPSSFRDALARRPGIQHRTPLLDSGSPGILGLAKLFHLRFAKMAREVVERQAGAGRDSHRDKLRQMFG